MTKKHFIELARVVMAQMPERPSESPDAMRQWESDKNALADFCASQNANFNRSRWLGYIDGLNGPNGGLR